MNTETTIRPRTPKLNKIYSKPVWSRVNDKRIQRGTVIARRIGNELQVSWSQCDLHDLKRVDNTYHYNTDHGRQLAMGRFFEIENGKSFNVTTADKLEPISLLVAGIPRTTLETVCNLVVNVLTHQSEECNKDLPPITHIKFYTNGKKNLIPQSFGMSAEYLHTPLWW